LVARRVGHVPGVCVQAASRPDMCKRAGYVAHAESILGIRLVIVSSEVPQGSVEFSEDRVAVHCIDLRQWRRDT